MKSVAACLRRTVSAGGQKSPAQWQWRRPGWLRRPPGTPRPSAISSWVCRQHHSPFTTVHNCTTSSRVTPKVSHDVHSQNIVRAWMTTNTWGVEWPPQMNIRPHVLRNGKSEPTTRRMFRSDTQPRLDYPTGTIPSVGFAPFLASLPLLKQC